MIAKSTQFSLWLQCILFVNNYLSISIYLSSIQKHYPIDIANPHSMQDAYHMNFVRDFTHRGVSVAQS